MIALRFCWSGDQQRRKIFACCFSEDEILWNEIKQAVSDQQRKGDFAKKNHKHSLVVVIKEFKTNSSSLRCPKNVSLHLMFVHHDFEF